ncbi:MAG: class I SAM-dependent methyltransferase [Bariatricus sp.]|nr:class I SAM-dependent methyltransferase [Bariatricus sp.]MDY5521117.1 class I SAM-dependent methyltransferase [Agathobacter sp.]
MSKKYLEINKNVYDSLAIEYAHRREHLSEYEETSEYLGWAVLKYCEETSNLPVLEIGPGAGQILAYFESQGCRTIGVELSDKMAHVAKSYSPNSTMIVGDINQVQFLEEQFHIIYLGAVFHLFPLEDAKILFTKINNWLTKDGYIFVNTTCNDVTSEGYFEKADYSGSQLRFRRKWTESDFENFVLKHGFEIVEKLYTDEVDRNKRWVAIIAKKKRCEI